MTKPKSSDRYDFLEGMIRLGEEALGREIVAAVEQVIWTLIRSANDEQDPRMWEGKIGKFRFVLVDFELASQGFPGHRAADGMVSVEGYGAIRLGHLFAAECVKRARKQNPNA